MRFYVSKFRNILFLLQGFEGVFKFHYKNISFYKYITFVERYKTLTILYILLFFLSIKVYS